MKDSFDDDDNDSINDKSHQERVSSALYDDDFDNLEDNINIGKINEELNIKNVINKEKKNISHSKTSIILDSFKILVIGGQKTGKKTIIKSVTGKDYNEGINKKVIAIANYNVSVEFILSDNFNKNYKSINGVIFVYSLKDKNSFSSLQKYIEIIEKDTKGVLLPKVILGTMKDLESLARDVSYEEAKKLSKLKDINFFEISGNDSNDIIKIIKNLIKMQKIYNKYKNFIFLNKINEKQFISSIKKNKLSLTKCENCNKLYDIYVDQYSHCISLYCKKCRTYEYYTYNEYEKLKNKSLKCYECKKEKNEKSSINFCYDCKNYICNNCIKTHLNKKKREKDKYLIYPYNLVDFSCNIHNRFCYIYCKKCRKNICVKCESDSRHLNHENETVLYNITEIKELIDKQKNNLINERKKYEGIKKNIDDCFNSLRKYFDDLILCKEKEMDLKEEMIKEFELYKYNTKLIENIKNLEFESNSLIYSPKSPWDIKLNCIFEFFKEPIKMKRIKICQKENIKGPFETLLPVDVKKISEKSDLKNNNGLDREIATDICFLHKYRQLNYYCVSFNTGSLKIFNDENDKFSRVPKLIIKEFEQNQAINSIYKSNSNENILFLVGNYKIVSILLKENLKQYKKIKEISLDEQNYKQVIQLDYYNSLIITTNSSEIFIYDLLEEKEKNITNEINPNQEKEILYIEKISDNKIIIKLSQNNLLGNVEVDFGRETMRDSLIPNGAFEENNISMSQRFNSTICNFEESSEIIWELFCFKDENNNLGKTDKDKNKIFDKSMTYLGKISEELLLFFNKDKIELVLFDFEECIELISFKFNSQLKPINSMTMSLRSNLLDLLILCEDGYLVQAVLNLRIGVFYLLGRTKINIEKDNKNLVEAENSKINKIETEEEEVEQEEKTEIVKIIKLGKRNYLLVNNYDQLYNMKV